MITNKLEQLAKKKTISLDDIKTVLDKYTLFATITRDEDQLLRDAKLNSKMPIEFYDENSSMYNDPFARYKKVGIEYEILKRNI